MIRTHLQLARASNLPTVWSNILAAVLIAGEAEALTILMLCLAGSLFYTAGMYLNDFFDADYDRRHRPERPIAAHQIERRTVLFFASGFLATGLCLSVLVSIQSLPYALLLIGCILWYDIDHKTNRYSPLVMAACRALLVLWAASSFAPELSKTVFITAAGLFTYIVGLTYLARSLNSPVHLTLSTLALSLPLWLNAGGLTTPVAWGAALIFVIWTARSLMGIIRSPKDLDFTISGLLAGIIWVDLLAICSQVTFQRWVFVCYIALFLVALIMQKKIQAT